MKINFKKILPVIVACLIPLAVGGLSALITAEDIRAYSIIKTPPFAPPGFLFPIVWTVLYILMGISSYLVWKHRKEMPLKVREALTTYAMSLIVNFSWSILFFKFGAFLLSFIWLLLLLYLIIKTIIQYFKIEKISAYLQIPYALWVTFAGILNLAIYFLNK
jgi:tryptophan-rich sensory protein